MMLMLMFRHPKRFDHSFGDPRRYAKAANKKMVAKTHVQGNVQVGADQDLLALEVGIGQIGHGLLAGRHGWNSTIVLVGRFRFQAAG